MTVTVRLATLQDVESISSLHRSYVTDWRTTDNESARPYEALTLFERWQNGGPWLSLETCSVHLYRLLHGLGTPLVAEVDGKVMAEAEVYESSEGPPFERCLHIGSLRTHAAYSGNDLDEVLLTYIHRMAELIPCARLTYAGDTLPGLLAEQGFRPLVTAFEGQVSSHAGHAVYQSTLINDPNPDQIKGWHMPLGHYQCARQEWDGLFPQDWATGIPELSDVTNTQIKMTVAGQNAVAFLQESGEPGVCGLVCWSMRSLSQPLVAALRDRAFRQGFHTIRFLVTESPWPLLESAEAQLTGARHVTYELPIKHG